MPANVPPLYGPDGVRHDPPFAGTVATVPTWVRYANRLGWHGGGSGAVSALVVTGATTMAEIATEFARLGTLYGAASNLLLWKKGTNQTVGATCTRWGDAVTNTKAFLPTSETPAGPTTTSGYLNGPMQYEDLTSWLNDAAGCGWGFFTTGAESFVHPLAIGQYSAETGSTPAYIASFLSGPNGVSAPGGSCRFDLAGALGNVTNTDFSPAGTGKTQFGALQIHPGRVAISCLTGRLQTNSTRADTASSRSTTASTLGTGNRRVRVAAGDASVRSWSGANKLEGVLRWDGVIHPSQRKLLCDAGVALFNMDEDARDLLHFRGNSFVNRYSNDAYSTHKAAFTSARGVCLNIIGWDGALSTGTVGGVNDNAGTGSGWSDATQDWGIGGTTRFIEALIDLSKCTRPVVGAFEMINQGGAVPAEIKMYDAFRAALGGASTHYFFATTQPNGGVKDAPIASNTTLRAAWAGHADALLDHEQNTICSTANNIAKYWSAAHPTDGNTASGLGGSATDCACYFLMRAQANGAATLANARFAA